jgi:hypothetical protein
MNVTLGPFARSGIESQVGANLVETVETAVRHYTDKVTSRRASLPYLQFLGTDTSRDFGTPISVAGEPEEIELRLDSETEAVLRREAMRYDTDVSAIAIHAVMIYLAELDFLSIRSRPL